MSRTGGKPASGLSRRDFLRLSAAVAVGSQMHGCSPLVASDLTEVRIAPPPGATRLSGMRIGFISDIHRSSYVSRADVTGMAQALDDADLDLLLVGGDLVTRRENRPDLMDEVLSILGEVRVRLGRAVVPGNHDVFFSPRHFPTAPRRGFVELTNRGESLSFQGQPLFLAGLDDFTMGHPDFTAALRGHEGSPLLFVSHNPDAFMDYPQGDVLPWLALSGHLHGGQVRIPLYGPLIRNTRYPEIFDWGFAKPREFPIYVSRGAGVVGVPMRLACPPELCLFVVSDLDEAS